MLWLRRDLAANHPCAIDKMLVGTGLARSLTEVRRLIGEGGVYVNNKKLVPPEEGFLPVLIIAEGMTVAEYIGLGDHEDD